MQWLPTLCGVWNFEKPRDAKFLLALEDFLPSILMVMDLDLGISMIFTAKSLKKTLLFFYLVNKEYHFIGVLIIKKLEIVLLFKKDVNCCCFSHSGF